MHKIKEVLLLIGVCFVMSQTTLAKKKNDDFYDFFFLKMTIWQ